VLYHLTTDEGLATVFDIPTIRQLQQHQIPADVSGGLLPMARAQIPNDYLLVGDYEDAHSSVLVNRRKGRDFWFKGNRFNDDDEWSLVYRYRRSSIGATA
jgi:hypothetical protein